MPKKKEKPTNNKKHNGKSNNNQYAELDDDDPPTKRSSKLSSLRRFKRGKAIANSSKKQQQQPSGKKSSNCTNSSDDTTFRKALERDGTRTVVDMASDGNCLFRSLADQLFADYGYHHDQVRADVCDFMERHQDEFSVFLVLDETESDHDAQDFASYIAAMREEGEWGGNLELVAAARCYSRNITVFSAPLAAFTIECGEGVKTSGLDLQLSYHDNDHYNSVRPTNGSIKPITKPSKSPTKTTPMKPKSSLSSSFKTVSSVSQSEEEGDAVEVELQEPPQQEHDKNNDDEENSTEPTVDSNPSSEATATCLGQDDNSKNKEENTTPPHQEKKETKKDVAKRKNGSCPCGSGLRYKKCCWTKEKHLARLKKLKGDNDVLSDHSNNNSNDEDNDEHLMNGHFRVLKI